MHSVILKLYVMLHSVDCVSSLTEGGNTPGAIAEYPAHSFTFVGSLYRTRQITIGTILIQ